MEPKRILFIIRSYKPDQVGGGAKSVQTLAEGLAERGHNVHVLRLAPKGSESAYYDRSVEAGIAGSGKPELHIMPLRNIYWPYGDTKHSRMAKAIWHVLDLYNPAAARDVRTLLKHIRPDVVNTSIIDGFSPSILRAIDRSGAKLIHTMRDYYMICTRSSMYRGDQNCANLCVSCSIVRTLNRRRLRHADLILSNSAFVAEAHKRFNSFSHDFPCAVQWNVNERPLALAPRELARNTMVFGYIGRLAPTKGVDKLIEAAATLPDAGRKWSLLIAGDGPKSYVGRLRKLAADVPAVRFLGWTSPESFYDQIDVLVCPSVYNEPLPRVIYEAYGYALPVIASRVGGHPEIVTEGQSGELYEAHNVAALAQHMQTFRGIEEHRYRTYSEHALRLGDMFTPDSVLDSFEYQMSQVLDQRGTEAAGGEM